jgi:hypothetical protein
LNGTRRLVMQRFPFSIVYLDEARFSNHCGSCTQQAKAGVLEGSGLMRVLCLTDSPPSRKARKRMGHSGVGHQPAGGMPKESAGFALVQFL